MGFGLCGRVNGFGVGVCFMFIFLEGYSLEGRVLFLVLEFYVRYV